MVKNKRVSNNRSRSPSHAHLWTAVIVTAVLVAVVASLITANISGNAVNVAKGRYATVYTVNETNELLKNKPAEVNIYRELIKRDSTNTANWKSCTQVCNDNGKKCFVGNVITGVITNNITYGGIDQHINKAYYQLNFEVDCKEAQPFWVAFQKLPPTSGRDGGWLWNDAYLSCSCF